MQSEKRRTAGRRYFYQSTREGDKVKKLYVGRGSDPVASIAFTFQKLRTAFDKSARSQRKAEQAESVACELAMTKIENLLQRMPVVESLRKDFLRNKHNNMKSKKDSRSTEDDVLKTIPSLRSLARLRKLVDQGDQVALARYRQLLQSVPELIEGTASLFDLTTRQCIACMAGESISTRTILEVQLESDIAKFHGNRPRGGLELLKTQLVMLLRLEAMRCHLALSCASTQSEVRFWSGMFSRAMRRYERALKSWAKG